MPANNSSETTSSGGMREELRTDVKQMTSTATDKIHNELDARKGTAATQVKSVSSALDSAAGQLDQDAPQWLKSSLQQGAKTIQQFADSLERKDSREIMDDVRSLARDNPGTFLAGCAAIGFAAARIFKAGGSQASTNPPRQTQLPPIQGEEPMFRQTGTQASGATSPAGEFA